MTYGQDLLSDYLALREDFAGPRDREKELEAQLDRERVKRREYEAARMALRDAPVAEVIMALIDRVAELEATIMGNRS